MGNSSINTFFSSSLHNNWGRPPPAPPLATALQPTTFLLRNSPTLDDQPTTNSSIWIWEGFCCKGHWRTVWNELESWLNIISNLLEYRYFTILRHSLFYHPIGICNPKLDFAFFYTFSFKQLNLRFESEKSEGFKLLQLFCVPCIWQSANQYFICRIFGARVIWK